MSVGRGTKKSVRQMLVLKFTMKVEGRFDHSRYCRQLLNANIV